MASRSSKSTARKVPRSHFADYLLAFSFAFVIVLVMGFIYVEDVRDGIGVLMQLVIDRWFSDIF